MNALFHGAPPLACALVILGCASAPQIGPSPDQVAAAPESLPEGRTLLLRTVEATGGQALWQGIQTMDFELAAELFTPEGANTATARIVYRMPGEMYRGNKLEGIGEINMLVRASDSWVKLAQEESLRAATPFEAEYIQAGLWRDLPFLLARVARGDDHGLELHTLPDAQIDGRRYQVLQVRPPYELPGYRLYIDAATGLPLKRAFSRGEVETEDVFSDFRTRSGVLLPWALRSYRDGEITEAIVYTEMRINSPVDPQLFVVD